MLKKICVIATAVTVIALALHAKTSPVLMKIGDKDVRLDEFLYLFNKNKNQQQDTLSTRQYLNLFTDYKIKVLAAEAAGLDTLASFVTDINNYTDELAAPYLLDKEVTDSMMHLTYERMKINPDISIITINSQNPRRDKQLADSLHNLISQGADFAALAMLYSDEKRSAAKGGHIGYISEGNPSLALDNAAFTTAPGEVSQPFTTQMGVHLLKVNGVRPDVGKVKTRHILKAYKTRNHSDSLEVRAKIDSIYQLLCDGANFAKLAAKTTDDPSGAKTGGDLPWFGPGNMIAAFEQMAYATPVGQFSKPFATAYGYHILLKEGEHQLGTFEQEKKNIEKITGNGERKAIAANRFRKKMRKRLGVTVNPKAMEMVKTIIEKEGKTPAILAELKKKTATAATIGQTSIPIEKIAATIPNFTLTANIPMLFETNLNQAIDAEVKKQSIALMRQEHPDLDNLINEYHDGMLLYEISNREVWGKPQDDKQGLEQYFRKNHDKYTWDKPRFKGFLIMAHNDSTARRVAAYINSNPQISNDSLSIAVRKEFGIEARIERVLAARGANKIVDFVAFGGSRPEGVGTWSSFLPVRHKIIEQPEEASDVKGSVSVDWQKHLEEQWMQRLRRTYKVSVNEKVFKTIE